MVQNMQQNASVHQNTGPGSQGPGGPQHHNSGSQGAPTGNHMGQAQANPQQSGHLSGNPHAPNPSQSHIPQNSYGGKAIILILLKISICKNKQNMLK